jgi:hypothetical protein
MRKVYLNNTLFSLKQQHNEQICFDSGTKELIAGVNYFTSNHHLCT